jgi:signal transduction histidine kinase/ligand-binding sensor domain-containing protein
MTGMKQFAGKRRFSRSAPTARFGSAKRIRHLPLAVVLVALFLAPVAIVAEQLPIRKYTTADGLASNAVACVKRDSRGFLWFCTAEGLSRFDGYTFTNYSVDQGLPDRLVTDFLETRNGDYWVGTYRGVVRFNPKPGMNQPFFTVYLPGETEEAQHVNSLFQDREGGIWVATNEGVYQMIEKGGKWAFRHLEAGTAAGRLTGSIQEDQEGNLWVVLGDYGNAALLRRSPNGGTEILTNSYLTKNKITGLFIDRENRKWASTYHGLALLAAHPTGPENLVARVFTKKDGLLGDEVGPTFQSSDGRLWVGSAGLLELITTRNEVKFRIHGLQEQGFRIISAEDVDGNFWMSQTKITNHGFVNYGREDGLRTEDIRSIVEGHDGELYVITGLHSRYISRFDGKGFTSVAPKAPGHDASWDWGTWGWGQLHFQDHLGEWWIGTGVGIYRYPRVRRLEDLAWTLPRKVYTAKEGLLGANIFRMYEDSKGDVWISSWGGGLLRWERATETFLHYGEKEGLPPNEFPTAYREDRAGNLWMGMWGHDLVRFRHGHFDAFFRADGFPDGSIFSIWLDHAGRLWAGTSRGGLVRIDEPDREIPRFRVYTTKEGLSSNNVRSITEDHSGRIYFWTGRGVDRLEPETGAVLHYTTADGLVPAGSDTDEAFCDRQGRLWFGFLGLSRLDPVLALQPAPLPIYVTHVRIRGVDMPISELGESRLSGLVLQPNQNNLQIEFGSLNFGSVETIRYQYKLENADSEWSPPSTLRSVNYAELRPGRYRFLVRAVGVGGEVSQSPAEISFRTLAPIWQRWWFLSLLAAVSGLVIYGLYQYRINRLLELERIRTRIASNLHDDIGSSLTQIAILSEVANRTLQGNGPSTSEPLLRIADISREAVDSMSDIVWAVNPGKDTLRDLIQRMRRFASDVLSARGIELSFQAPEGAAETELRGDLRQEIFFIFKEGINNIVRHAGSRRVEVQLSLDDGYVLLGISDDGKGFAVGQSDRHDGHGHGLVSMRARAQNFGGACEISSQPDQGTRVSVRMPMERRRDGQEKIPT